MQQHKTHLLTDKLQAGQQVLSVKTADITCNRKLAHRNKKKGISSAYSKMFTRTRNNCITLTVVIRGYRHQWRQSWSIKLRW